MYQRHQMTGTVVPLPQANAPLHAFVQSRNAALRDAATLLAGPRGGRLVDAISDSLSLNPTLSRCTRIKLRELLSILSLENVHDDDREEAARFAAIDPASPVVEQICLLTDELHNALDEVDAVLGAPLLGFPSAA